mgnify:FL=1
MPYPINVPAGYVPLNAIAFSTESDAVSVDADHPLPISEPAYRGAIPFEIDVDQQPRRALAVICTTSGTVTLKLADNSVIAVPISQGLSLLPFAVKSVTAQGTTAIASYFNLI